MQKLTLDLSHSQKFLDKDAYNDIVPRLQEVHQKLIQHRGQGNDFLGWLDLPSNFDQNEFTQIKQAASKIQNQSQVLVVIGIGGSYLGARAGLEFIFSPNYNNIAQKTPQIYFIGNNLSAQAIQETIDLIGERDFSVNVISKSGTTTEPALAFRIFRQLLIDKYGKKAASERIIATTDKARGALKTLADQENYQTMVVPDDIGGRYSVLTAVGLLPMAVADIDLDALFAGAKAAQNDLNCATPDNLAWQYAGYRYLLERSGKNIEILAYYEPSFRLFGEWWKQLFGESEGKNGQGLFPASVEFTTDLHSLGQYIQDGKRQLFETVIWLDQPSVDLTIKKEDENLDKLNYLAGKSLHYVNQQAFLGTLAAHINGGVPNLILHLPKKDAWSLGYLFYFFEFSCALSGYLLDINPFDQPGVEAYKKNMFALLGKT